MIKLSDYKLKEPQRYYISCQSFSSAAICYRKIDNAEPFNTKLLVNADLFIAYYDDKWHISEAHTGGEIASAETKAECILLTCNKLRKKVIKEHNGDLEWAVIKWVTKYKNHFTPRYEKVRHD